MSKLNDSNALDTLDMDVLLSELKNPIVGLKIGNRKVIQTFFFFFFFFVDTFVV